MYQARNAQPKGCQIHALSPLQPCSYAETVIHRIFYALDRSCSGRLSHRDLRRSDLLQVLHQVDEEEDINKVLQFFSYEHFYVIYCKFWDLDAGEGHALRQTGERRTRLY